MEFKKAITVLKSLLENPSLNNEEKEAVFTAIGILAWISTAKRRKADSSKEAEWPASAEVSRLGKVSRKDRRAAP